MSHGISLKPGAVFLGDEITLSKLGVETTASPEPRCTSWDRGIKIIRVCQNDSNIEKSLVFAVKPFGRKA